MQIAAVGCALPPNRYDQKALVEAFTRYWAAHHHNTERVRRFHEAVEVGTRHLALPMEDYPSLDFGAANDAYIRVATDVGHDAVRQALTIAGLEPSAVDAIFFTTVTGIATPSIDARLHNRLGLRTDVKRVPIFGLGCVAGAAGVARLYDYLRAWPEHVAILVSVELCSLTLQRTDLTIPNLIASGLFGDGGACVVGVGDAHEAAGPRVVATRSRFYPDTEGVMGWEIDGDGMRIVLDASVPEVVRRFLREDVDGFLADQGLSRGDIASWVCHPGGPKVLTAFQETLELPADALQLTWDSLRSVGNLSSSSVLFVLRDTIDQRRPPPGSLGLMLAMGPGFCSELVLLRW